MIYRCEFFAPYELVGPDIFHMVPADRIWWLFDPKVLWTADMLRKRFGPSTINTWRWGGHYKESGLRSFSTKTGAKWSQHKFGRAIDQKFKHATAEEVRRDMLANPDREAYRHITCLETGVSWVHWDVRNWDKMAAGGYLLVKP